MIFLRGKGYSSPHPGGGCKKAASFAQENFVFGKLKTNNSGPFSLNQNSPKNYDEKNG